jgi:hypothetical protein
MTIQGNYTTASANNYRINTTISTGTLTIGGSLALNNNSSFTISSTGIVNIGTNFSGGGLFTFSANGNLFIGGNNTSNGTFNRGTGTVTYNGTGAQTVRATTYYNLTINKTAGTATLANNTTINTGTLTVSQGTLSIGTRTLTATGNVIVNGTISGTGAITLSGTNRTINGTGSITSTGNFTMSGGAKTILATANLTITGRIVIGSGFTAVTVTNNGTITSISTNGITASLTNSRWVNATNSRLNIAGPLLTTGTLTANANLNTVNYNGTTAAQTVKATTYYNLTITKVTQIATLAGATPVNGNLTISSGTLAASTYAMTIGGYFVNVGTFNGNTGSVTMSGTGASISGAGTFNFYTLAITGSGVTVNANTSLNIANNLSTSGSGSFTHTSGGTGSITMSGATKTISGTGIQLDDLNISGSVTMNSSISMAGNLNVIGTLTGTAGTILTMSGNGSTISGGGTITLNTLSITNNVSATTNVQINGNLSGGTLTATSGIFTFNGTLSQLSGTANLYDVVINGTRTLQLTTNSTLGIANTLTLTGSLDAVNGGTPNTVGYNGTGTQSIIATAYHNLALSNGNTKTAAGALTVNGNLLIIDIGTTFAAGVNAHIVQGNWTNNGTFTASTSTVQLSGSSDAIVNGSSVTTFSTLTISKDDSTNTVTGNTNINVDTLNVTNGNIAMGANNITITGTRTGNGIITGTITHTHAFSTGTVYSFEGPNNTIAFSTVGTVTSVSITVTIGSVADFPFGGSINRQYNIAVTGAGYTAALRLHYLDGELNGNVESTMQLWRYNGSTWGVSGKTANDATNNWVEQSGLTNITNRWTISNDQNVVRWNGSTTAWSTASNWTAIQGSPSTPPSTDDIVQIGDISFTNQPTISSDVTIKNIIFSSTQVSTITLSSGGSLTVNSISGQWSSNAVHALEVGTQTLNVNGNLVLSDGITGHTINLNVGSGTVNISGSLTELGGVNITLGSGNIKIGGDFIYSSGTFAGGTSTVTYNGATDQIVAGVNYNNLTIDKSAGTANLNSPVIINGNLTLSMGGALAVNAELNIGGNVNIGASTSLNANGSAITVGGNWIRMGTFTSGTSTVVFKGSGAQSIDATTFNNIIINKASGIASPGGALTINGNLTDSTGTLDLGNLTANRSALGGTFRMAANTLLRLSGANNFPTNYSVNSLDDRSTVEYYGTDIQTIPGLITHGNLLINKTSGNAVLNNNITVNGNLTVTEGDIDLNGSTIALGDSAMVSETVGNTIKGNGTITGTIKLNAPSAVNAFGLGATITSTADLGTTVIIRGHTRQSITSDSSILRYYVINPEVNTGLNATLVFKYDDSELAGLIDSTLCLYSSIDDGISWLKMNGTVSITSKTVTLDSIDEFSMWTLSSQSAMTGVEEPRKETTNSIIPKVYALSQNYPNPFNPTTSISFDLPKQSHVILKIFDIIGREVATLMDEDFSAGKYTKTWNASSFSSGVYFCRIDARQTTGSGGEIFVSTKKLLLVK